MLGEVASRFSAANCYMMAAALAFYAAFSIPPLVVITISLLGYIVKPEDVRGEVGRQMTEVMGETTHEQVKSLIDFAQTPDNSLLGSLVGIGFLLIAATGALTQLQFALNEIWNVQKSSLRLALDVLLKRLISLGMLLILAFLILVSLGVNTLVSAFGDELCQWLPEFYTNGVIKLIDFGASYLILVTLFGAMMYYLPMPKSNCGQRSAVPL